MRAFIFALMGLMFVATAWAANFLPRSYSADGIITSSRAIILDGNIYFKGATVGDSVVLYNGTSTSGTKFMTLYVPTANGFLHIVNKETILCDSGIYADFTASSGIVGMDLLFQ